MHLVVNALSATNLSGAAVLGGHLAQWEREGRFAGRLTLLCHAGNRDTFLSFAPSARVHLCPDATRGWPGRAAWQRLRLPALLRSLRADVLLSGSGMVSCPSPIPEVTYAMNPWALVPGVAGSGRAALKALLQRRAYAAASRRAAGIAFLSDFMRQAYERNAGHAARDGAVVYPGLPEDVLHPGPAPERHALRIVSASAMAPHKRVEHTLRALAELRGRLGVPATLLLLGGWPDPAYRAAMESLARGLGLAAHVEFRGHADRATWVRELASARVFCLMTECESFGIPAAEAQALGTPVVSSNVCAVPEVCGDGGLCSTPGDAAATASRLHRLLADDGEWARLSAAARANAARFTWSSQSARLADLLLRVAGRSSR